MLKFTYYARGVEEFFSMMKHKKMNLVGVIFTKLLNFKRTRKTSYSKLMDESYTKRFMVTLQTSDIQMKYEYIRVLYG